MKQILERVKTPPHPFFTGLRNIGLVVAGLATALLTAPVALPVMVNTLAGYLLTAGTVATVISQLTVNEGEQLGSTDNTSKGGEHGSKPQP